MWRAFIEPMVLLAEIECRIDVTSTAAKELVEQIDTNFREMKNKFPGNIEAVNLGMRRRQHKHVPPYEDSPNSESEQGNR